MPTHIADPDWFWQVLSSPPFFISLAVTFICSFFLNPFLSNCLVPQEKYQKLGKKKTFFNSFLSSAVHGVTAVVLSCLVLGWTDLGEDKIFNISPAAISALHVTLGYTVADTVLCLSDPYLRGHYVTILHHVAMFTGIGMGLYHRLFIFFIVYRLLSEFSTPFVDLWTVLREVGNRNGRLFYVASVGMMTSFFLCRVLVIPWHNYELLAAIFSPAGSVVPWYLHLYMIVNFTAFDAFNLYWFSKMLRGGYKLLMQKKRRE